MNIQNQCVKLLQTQKTTVMELTKLIGLLSFTTQAVIPARLQHRFLQRQQIQALNKSQSYQADMILNKQSLEELLWWKENLILQNGKPLQLRDPDKIIQTDASKVCWGAACQGMSTGSNWSVQEQNKHINVLELIVVKLAIKTFSKLKKLKMIHL